MHSLVPITVFAVLSLVGIVVILWYRIKMARAERSRWAVARANIK
jgi:hypothetical protein